MEEKRIDWSGILIFAFLLWTCLCRIIETIIFKVCPEWYSNITIYTAVIVMGILYAISYLLPAIAIKNLTMKIIAIILSGIYALYCIGNSIWEWIERYDYMTSYQ